MQPTKLSGVFIRCLARTHALPVSALSYTTVLYGLALLLCAGAFVGLHGCSEETPSGPEVKGITPPSPTSSIQFLSPARGGMVSSGTTDISPITLSGVACDSASTITDVTIDGQPATLSGSPPCLDFTAVRDSRWGMNIILASATNQTGYTENIVQSYLRSPGYFAPAVPGRNDVPMAAAADKVPGGIYLQLNPGIMDDLNRTDLDDFASLFNQVVAGINFNDALPITLVPAPATKLCDCPWPLPDISLHEHGVKVTRNTISHSIVQVDNITLVNGGFDMQVRSSNMSMGVTVTSYSGSCFLGCVDPNNARTTAFGMINLDDMTITANVRVSLGADGRPFVTVFDVLDTLDNLRIVIDWGLLEFLDQFEINTLTNELLDEFQTAIVDLVVSELLKQIPSLVETFIGGFEPPAKITLPPPMRTAVNFESQFDMIDFKPGSARLGIAVAASPANPMLRSPMGPIRRGGAVPAFSVTPYAIGVGIKDDLLNQFLWAVWVGGALEIPDVSVLGCAVPEGFKVSMSATLPPVVMPGTTGNQIDIGVGDVYIEASLPPGASAAAGLASTGYVAIYAASIAGATIAIDPGNDKLAITLQENPEVAVQIISAPQGADLEMLSSEYTELVKCLLTTVLQAVIGAYPLPTVAIGAANLPGVPPDSRWVLDQTVVDRQDPYYTITGEVVVK